MRRTLRYFTLYGCTNLAVILVFFILVTLGCRIPNLPEGIDRFIQAYYGMFPFITLILLYSFSASQGSIYLQQALSFGGLRRDYFRAMQVYILLWTLLIWLLQSIIANGTEYILPGTASEMTLNIARGLQSLPLLSIPLVCIAEQLAGIVTGLALMKSRGWGVVLLVTGILCNLLIMFALIALGIVGDFQNIAEESVFWRNFPEILSVILPVGALVLCGICELIFWKSVKDYAVT